MITIDGSYGSGGGQILRTACSLAAVTKKPCRVFNIRKNRPKPGLATQHLLGIQSLAKLCNGKLEGDYLGSEEIKFYPGKDIINSTSPLRIKIETAGSITLVLQTLILPALFSSEPTEIIFNGGATDTFFSPTIDYFQYVFLEILKKLGIKVDTDIIKRGFYPAGGAKVEITVYPALLKPISLLERGELKQIIIISGASQSLQKSKVAERQLSGVKSVLGPKLKLPITEKVEYYSTLSPGSQVNIIARFENTIIGSDNLGKLGKSAEIVGKETAQNFFKNARTDACLDKYLADQILPYMALASEKSQVTVSEVTNHCKTNMWVIEKFLNGKFKIENNQIRWSR